MYIPTEKDNIKSKEKLEKKYANTATKIDENSVIYIDERKANRYDFLKFTGIL